MTRRQYSDDELLSLSGIQHFFFCKRQWALIHVEQSWQENKRTAEGRVVHKIVDDPDFHEVRNGIRTLRSVKVASKRLGLFGICDQIDVSEGAEGMSMQPVEYKVGKPKSDDRDRVQLCAQCICLEEMYNTHISTAFLYYHDTRRRNEVEMTEDLRNITERTAEEMRALYEEGVTPPPVKSRRCDNCSLIDICVPELGSATGDVRKYVERQIDTR
ncbi:MAG: CRISPR-associated protein Cas4 [Methanomassiliicoccales archaeon]|nr:CRISPR-associated protein Cas4 [Methanomassiliicoccales archaeon]